MTVPVLLGEDFHVNYEIRMLRDRPLGSRLILPEPEGYIPAHSIKGDEEFNLSVHKIIAVPVSENPRQLSSKPDKGMRYD